MKLVYANIIKHMAERYPCLDNAQSRSTANGPFKAANCYMKEYELNYSCTITHVNNIIML